jgi:hypothetical protein
MTDYEPQGDDKDVPRVQRSYRYQLNFEKDNQPYHATLSVSTDYPQADELYGPTVFKAACERFLTCAGVALLSVMQIQESFFEIPDAECAEQDPKVVSFGSRPRS